MNPRRASYALGLAAAAAILAGCGSDHPGDAVKLSGDCSTSKTPLKPQQLISEKLLGDLLGEGDYVALPGVVVDGSNRVPAAFNSTCSFAPHDDKGDVRLKIALLPRTDPGYAVAQQALEAKEGVTVVDASTYVTADPTSDSDGNRIAGAKGVRVLPDRVVMVEIIKPGHGVDAMHEAASAVASVADNVQHLGQ